MGIPEYQLSAKFSPKYHLSFISYKSGQISVIIYFGFNLTLSYGRGGGAMGETEIDCHIKQGHCTAQKYLILHMCGS